MAAWDDRRIAALPLPMISDPAHQTPAQRALAVEINSKEPGHGYPVAYMSAGDHRLVKAAYYAAIEHLDAAVGRLLAVLDDTGQADDTIVLFHSDHGEMLGDHGFYKKHTGLLYDAAVRVPLIARYPGHWAAGQVDQGLVELTDLAPTLYAACGVQGPRGIHGIDLGPRLRAEPGAKARRDAFTESYGSLCIGNHTLRLTTEEHTLVLDVDDQAGQLFVHADDPQQCVNRWDDPGMATCKTALLTRLAARMAHASDHGQEQAGVY